MATEANVVVAKDGSGKYDSIAKAVAEVQKGNTERFVIHIKEGVYDERVDIPKGSDHITFVGDGPTKTVLTGDVSVEKTQPKPTTFDTATLSVNANNFIAKNIGIENTAGPEGHQAVALRASGDMGAFFNCHFNGYQDTLYAHRGRQYYRDCVITGTIDFVFGDASAVFQSCHLIVRKPMENQSCIFIAQGRKDEESKGGFVFQNCTFSGDNDYYPVMNKNKTYLNRPWKDFATVIIMQSQIDDIVQPEGYIPMNGDHGLATSYYVEYGNRGPGSNTEGRVKWPGIKQIDETEIKKFTPGVFIESETWIPSTGIPCVHDMIPGI
ncbi:Pectin Methylesterase 58 [Hibiscus trionum]|uniref:Pectinesterase n=1 Tax=Hibiscus trionum TaxID=183268 RepID=A0A9W7IIN5_HIBTR|nr:Pectin Methylesterase 58 [Hibiscus trionum]